MSVLEQLTQCEADRAEAAMIEYQRIVVALAANDEPELEAVQSVLAETGKTAQQLAVAVRALQSLGSIIDELVRAQVGSHERAEVLATIQAADTEMESLLTVHRQKMLPLQSRVQQLEQLQQVAVNTKGRLIEHYCKNHHKNSPDTNERNGLNISHAEALVAELGRIEFEAKRTGGSNKLINEKAAAVEQLNQLKLEILDNAKNLQSGY